ncbi:MAG: transcriptional repressor LexA [Alphaproteobacteria bacterium]|nr:transcriptional repressor LexA [Alphaproteobacteria bacterium]MBF0354281.1 transcriptional repressor LexA [Alphaproteobacteria bacterium]
MLTKKQYELLMFIEKRLKESGVSPSFDEMKEALGLKSKSGIHRLITGLEERGFLNRLPHRARALEVTRLPDNIKDDRADPRPVPSRHFKPQLVRNAMPQPNRAPLPGRVVTIESPSAQIPLWGRIAAGTPIEAMRDHSTTVDVPMSLLGSGEHYALTIDGDSMIDAGIMDGDTVLVRSCDTAENGTIVVALVDENEVTLKRLRRKGASIALEPANTKYETRIFGPDRVKVQGRLIGLIRSY